MTAQVSLYKTDREGKARGSCRQREWCTLKSKDCWSYKVLEKAKNGFSPRIFKRPANALALDFWPPELWKSMFLFQVRNLLESTMELTQISSRFVKGRTYVWVFILLVSIISKGDLLFLLSLEVSQHDLIILHCLEHWFHLVTSHADESQRTL